MKRPSSARARQKYLREQYENAYFLLATESEQAKAEAARAAEQEPREADEIWREYFADQNMRDVDMERYRQYPLRSAIINAGIDIPEDYLGPEDMYGTTRLFTKTGEAKLRQALYSHRINRAKDIAGIVGPTLQSILAIVSIIFSSIIAILGLLVAYRHAGR